MTFSNSIKNQNNLITTLFVDVYGVLHEGGNLFPGVKESLEKYKKYYKIIIISNTTPECEEVIKSLSTKGLEQGVHYDAVITSGDVFIEEIKNNKSLIYTMYSKYPTFEKYSIPQTSDITQAQNVYIGIPQNEKGEDIKIFDVVEEGKSVMSFLKDKNYKLDFIEKYIESLKGKKVYCANSDLVAIKDGEMCVRQGFVGLYLQNRNIDVKFFGKPYRNIFEKALREHNVKPQNVLMIGDQYSTDLGCDSLGLNTALIRSQITDLTKDLEYFHNKICTPDVEVKHIAELERFLTENRIRAEK